AVAAGFFPRTFIADDVAAGRLVEVAVRDLAPITRASALVRRPRPSPPTPAIAAIVAAIRDQAAALDILVGANRGRPAVGRRARSRRTDRSRAWHRRWRRRSWSPRRGPRGW